MSALSLVCLISLSDAHFSPRSCFLFKNRVMLLVAVEAKCHCMNVRVQVCKICVLNLGGVFFFF